MYCRKCGQQNDDNNYKCVKCGEVLQQAPAAAPVVPVPNYLVQAILVTLFCCLPCGIVAIVYAAGVNGKVQAGDITGALVASGNAKTWCWVSFVLGIILVPLYILGQIGSSMGN